jgi:hypothetical protein
LRIDHRQRQGLIGPAIAVCAAGDGANVAIARKQLNRIPKLAGMIFRALEAVREGGRAPNSARLP